MVKSVVVMGEVPTLGRVREVLRVDGAVFITGLCRHPGGDAELVVASRVVVGVEYVVGAWSGLVMTDSVGQVWKVSGESVLVC